MISESKKDVFAFANTGYIVNTVNTEKVMGKGIAKEFKLRYPEYFQHYLSSNIKNGGDIDIYKNIISFATKESFRNSSNISWIDKGLKTLKELCINKNIKTVVSPYLGCGNGRLNKNDVWELANKYFSDSDIDFIFALGIEDSDDFSEKTKYILTNINSLPVSNHVKNLLIENKSNIKLFRDFGNIKGIGAGAYKKLLEIEAVPILDLNL